MCPRIHFPVYFRIRVGRRRNLCGMWKVEVREQPCLGPLIGGGQALPQLTRHPSALSPCWSGHCQPSSLGFSGCWGCQVCGCVLEGPPPCISLRLEVVRDPRRSQFVFTGSVCPWPPPPPLPDHLSFLTPGTPTSEPSPGAHAGALQRWLHQLPPLHQG